MSVDSDIHRRLEVLEAAVGLRQTTPARTTLNVREFGRTTTYICREGECLRGVIVIGKPGPLETEPLVQYKNEEQVLLTIDLEAAIIIIGNWSAAAEGRPSPGAVAKAQAARFREMDQVVQNGTTASAARSDPTNP